MKIVWETTSVNTYLSQIENGSIFEANEALLIKITDEKGVDLIDGEVMDLFEDQLIIYYSEAYLVVK